MKKYMLIVALAGCSRSGCGDQVIGGHLVGQVKASHTVTGLLCSPYDEADVSMGVFRGGVGSASTQDLMFYVPDPAVYAKFVDFASAGAIVDVTYSESRFAWCVDAKYATSVQLAKP